MTGGFKRDGKSIGFWGIFRSFRKRIRPNGLLRAISTFLTSIGGLN
jgi:hypothetical protein